MAAQKKSKFLKGDTGEWEVVIGMEVHAQVTSNSKLFSGASTEFGNEPNSNVSLVDAAMPGMLPVINEMCVEQAVKTGLGLKAQINLKSVFDRKNYFYPDLPQGYQISQYKSPVVGEGKVVVDMQDGESIEVGIERLHLEQDAGKSIHDQHATMSLVDLNRSGVALMEIVSKPDLRSSDEARAYLTKLRTILRYLGTCDGDMEKGSLRADVNVSVRKPGAPLGTRCEIKNVNSIRFVGQAIETEARRQIEIIEDGGKIDQETRLFDPGKGETRSMRSKEEAHDYRYFPDPDLLPLEFDDAFVAKLKAGLPELPDEKKARFVRMYDLSLYEAGVLVAEKTRADYYEAMISEGADPKEAANWLINEYLGRLEKEIDALPTTPMGPMGSTEYVGQKPLPGLIGPVTSTEPEAPVVPNGPVGPSEHSPHPSVVLGPTGPAANTQIVRMISSGQISRNMAKDLLSIVIQHGPMNDPKLVIQIAIKRGFQQISDIDAIEKVVNRVIEKNSDKAQQAKLKEGLLGWFVGQVMKETGGKANPQVVSDLLKKKLGV